MPTLVTGNRPAGFFSMFNQVLGVLHHCERTGTFPVVDFSEATWGRHAARRIARFRRSFPFLPDAQIENGLYYEADRGSNWWNYYFEPIGRSPGEDAVFTTRWQDQQFSLRGAYLRRVTAQKLIQKYIRLRPEPLQKVREFQTAHFTGSKVGGVHFRGTDSRAAIHTTYEQFLEPLKRRLRSGKLTKIFVATDEAAFLDFARAELGDRVIARECARSQVVLSAADRMRNSRAGSPIAVHLNTSLGSPYTKGLDVLVDCLLLSVCDFICLSKSNISLAALAFNPKLQHQWICPKRSRQYARFSRIIGRLRFWWADHLLGWS